MLTTDTKKIPYEELKEFDEVLAAGTAAALVPIKSITLESKNDKLTYLSGSEPGPVCLKLLSTLKGIQQGKIEDKQGWLLRVQRPEIWNGKSDSGEEETVDQLP